MRDFVVSYSGGLGSFGAACRLIEQYGRGRVQLLFADTKIEDEDLYRFVDESSDKLGVELIRLVDGRTPWDVFRDVKYIGNSRVAPCSRVLKTEPCMKWLEENYPDGVNLALGIGYDEEHRLYRAQKNWAENCKTPVNVIAPLCDDPVWTKDDVAQRLIDYGIKQPRLYDMGFPHNNCGGFCVRAGQAQFERLLRFMPERFKWHEYQMENAMRENPKAKPFLRQVEDGELSYITLRQFRDQVNSGVQTDMFDWGGCGCFVDSE